uniref:Uncharacterized protein n=1 Tax=Pipistrellus kuhlii TaxID=59472 RepID=A0A7J7TQ92_PIPKU|nr:hypothetical protein mPipKuh1_009298 [Pipistrellus kuhlii]
MPSPASLILPPSALPCRPRSNCPPLTANLGLIGFYASQRQKPRLPSSHWLLTVHTDLVGFYASQHLRPDHRHRAYQISSPCGGLGRNRGTTSGEAQRERDRQQLINSCRGSCESDSASLFGPLSKLDLQPPQQLVLGHHGNPGLNTVLTSGRLNLQ